MKAYSIDLRQRVAAYDARKGTQRGKGDIPIVFGTSLADVKKGKKGVRSR